MRLQAGNKKKIIIQSLRARCHVAHGTEQRVPTMPSFEYVLQFIIYLVTKLNICRYTYVPTYLCIYAFIVKNVFIGVRRGAQALCNNHVQCSQEFIQCLRLHNLVCTHLHSIDLVQPNLSVFNVIVKATNFTI